MVMQYRSSNKVHEGCRADSWSNHCCVVIRKPWSSVLQRWFTAHSQVTFPILYRVNLTKIKIVFFPMNSKYLGLRDEWRSRAAVSKKTIPLLHR
jgi:hypothetical protein